MWNSVCCIFAGGPVAGHTDGQFLQAHCVATGPESVQSARSLWRVSTVTRDQHAGEATSFINRLLQNEYRTCKKIEFNIPIKDKQRMTRYNNTRAISHLLTAALADPCRFARGGSTQLGSPITPCAAAASPATQHSMHLTHNSDLKFCSPTCRKQHVLPARSSAKVLYLLSLYWVLICMCFQCYHLFVYLGSIFCINMVLFNLMHSLLYYIL